MRRVHALAAACATVVPVGLLAGCSDRPNDLYTYYDDPSSAVAAAPAPPTAAAPPTTTTAARPAGPDPAEVVALAGLGPSDLAAEKVAVDGAPVSTTTVVLPDCGVDLAAEAGRQSTWKYPSGSLLRQYVAYSTTASTAVDAARRAIDCRTFEVDGTTFLIDGGATVQPLPGVDDQLTWCASAPTRVTCTILLARDDLVTAVTVEAGTAARARSAITRLAPKAAQALARGA